MENENKLTFDPELYSEEQLDAIEEHIEQHFGHYETVFHELFSPDIHVDICVITPTEEKNYYTLVTMGMGAHLMNVPEKFDDQRLKRAELVICLPPDWNINSNDERDYWPIRLLKNLARLPIECDTWLGWGHTVDYEKPFAINTELSAAIILNTDPFGEDSCVCDLPECDEVNFYQVIPIYDEEKSFKIEQGANALLEHFNELDFVVDIERDPVVDYSPVTIMDVMDWHVGSIREKNLPIDEINGFNHMAVYLRWCIEHDLMCDSFIESFYDLITAVKNNDKNADLRIFIRDVLDGSLYRELFNEEGEEFAEFYYDHSHDEDEPCYPMDVDRYALEYFGKEKYACEEFQDEAYLFVPYDEKYYNGLKAYIDRYYDIFLNY